MRALRIAALLLAAATCPAWGAYQWYLQDNFVSPNSNWTVLQGSPSYNWGGGGGLYGNFVVAPSSAPPGGWTDYEVQGVAKCGWGPIFRLLARMNQDASSYYFLAVNCTSVASPTVSVGKVVSGVTTTFTSFVRTNVSASSGLFVRLVVRQNKIVAWTDSASPYIAYDNDLPAGQPGVGGSVPGYYGGGPITAVKLGVADAVPPGSIDTATIAAVTIPTGVTLQWPAAADDSNGIGLAGYVLYRDGGYVGSISPVSSPTFIDETVAPGENHSYTVYARDFHDNWSTQTPKAVTIPQPLGPAFRTGIHSAGSYWGAAGEQIDLVSGNLNFSVPLIKAVARGGWSVPFGLSYNSQSWLSNSGASVRLGADVGYGFGWKLQAGSGVRP